MAPPPAGGRDGEGGDTQLAQPQPLAAQPSAGMLEQMWASVHLASSAAAGGRQSRPGALPVVGAPSLKSFKSGAVGAPSAGLLSSGDDASPAGSYIGAGEHPPRVSGSSGLGSGALPSCSEDGGGASGSGGGVGTRRGPVTRARGGRSCCERVPTAPLWLLCGLEAPR